MHAGVFKMFFRFLKVYAILLQTLLRLVNFLLFILSSYWFSKLLFLAKVKCTVDEALHEVYFFPRAHSLIV